MRRLFLLGTAAVSAALMAGACTASAVTIGQVPSSTPFASCSNSPFDLVQPTVSSGNSYVVPDLGGVTAWRLTSWSTFAAAGDGQTLTMKVFRKVADPDTYQAV